MKQADTLIQEIRSGAYDDKLADIYGSTEILTYQKERYISAITRARETFPELSGRGISVFSAPGRAEIGGNHTDHQHGNVLCAAVDVDAIAVTAPSDDGAIRILSEGYPMMSITLDKLDKNPSEAGTTEALIKGMLYAVREAGYNIGGFSAYITSDVLSGSGLSSSAAFETLIGTILSGLFNDDAIDAVSIAKYGQFAENDFFGKPCGLMDQMACSVGSLTQIDFFDPKQPKIHRITFDLDAAGYALVITDTKGSHADLTDDYAAVPAEMKAAAACFGRAYLRDVDEDALLAGIPKIRETCGDRAALRALHFLRENHRAVSEADALSEGDFDRFLLDFRASGDSSFKYLQNVYTNKDVAHQNVSVGLAVSDLVLGNDGCARVHGGGFAGTIQAFVKKEAVARYQKAMEDLYGEGASTVMRIRKYGGTRVM